MLIRNKYWDYICMHSRVMTRLHSLHYLNSLSTDEAKNAIAAKTYTLLPFKIIFLLFFITPLITYSQIIEKEITDWEFRMVGDSVWKKAKVPGTIIDNFVDLSDITNPQHPYYGDNEKLYQWIGEKDWEFRTNLHFSTSEINHSPQYVLVFEQLDLFAKVNIDGHIYYHQNAFYPAQCPFIPTHELTPVHITFFSTNNKALQLQNQDSLKLPGGERVYARTPQYQFGWDWGPKYLNMGIRRNVVLKKLPDERSYFSHFNIKTEKAGKKNATVKLDFIITTPLNTVDIYIFKYENGNKNETKISRSVQLEPNKPMKYWFEQMNSWWPNGMNQKSSYHEFEIKITPPGDTTTILKKRFYYAVCDIKLIKEKDKKGESFYFTVNGEKVFAKGANYIPDDGFHPGKKTQQLVKLAADANMNMLRIWGGGTYPEEDFYIECMKNGIMIWQDFMFACAMYPGNQDFFDNVYEEANFQTGRLANYNHIATWCGNNENEEGWKNWGWQKEFNYSSSDSSIIWNNYLALTDTILHYHISKNFEYEKYISTSPKHGWGRKESMTEGDSHYWGVWWGLEPIEKYNEKVPRFMSEFGMQGMPDMETLKKVIPDSAMNFDSPLFKNHQKHPTGFQTLDHYLKEYLVIPDNMEDYAYATQVLQAYALTTAIEAQRRTMPYCMGSLIWQLNDCWPVTSWSLVDSELKKKIAYDEVWRVFGPSLLSLQEEENSYDIYLVNENMTIQNIELIIDINDFYGKNVWEKSVRTKAPQNSSSKIYSIDKKSLVDIDLTQVYLYCYIRTSDKVLVRPPITEAYFHFVRPNQLKLPKADFEIIEEDGIYYFNNKTYIPYLLFPLNLGYYGEFWGNTPPGKYSLSINKEQANYLKGHLTEIRCLNGLLNK